MSSLPVGQPQSHADQIRLHRLRTSSGTLRSRPCQSLQAPTRLGRGGRRRADTLVATLDSGICRESDVAVALSLGVRMCFAVRAAAIGEGAAPALEMLRR